MGLTAGLGDGVGATCAIVSNTMHPASAKRGPLEWPISLYASFGEAPQSTLFLNRYGISLAGGPAAPVRKYEHSVSTTLEVWGHSVCAHHDMVAVFDSGAAANMV